MRFNLKIINIFFLIFSISTFLLYLENKNLYFLYFFAFILTIYFLLIQSFLSELKVLTEKIKNTKNFHNKKIKPRFFFEVLTLFNFIKTFFSKYQLIEAVNLTLSKNSQSENFYRAVVENLGLIFNTPHLGFFVYDPVIEKTSLMHGNGIFSSFGKEFDFPEINNLDSNMIYKSEVKKYFYKDINNIKTIGVLKLTTPLDYVGYLMFSFQNFDLNDSFFTEYSSLALEVQTSFSLYINTQKLKEKIDELNLLNKINLLMEKNRNVNEVLHLFLTHITAKEGLAFNRAIMFEKKHNNSLQGVKSIGPLTFSEAKVKWEDLKSCPIDFFLEKNISNEKEIEPLEKLTKSSFLNLETDPILKSIVLSKKAKTIILDKSNFSKHNIKVFKKLNLNQFIIVPMICYEKFLGLIIVDNHFDYKAFSIDRVSSLINFTNQTSLVMHNLDLYNQIKTMSIKDELTQLYNRRYFLEKLISESDRAIRNKKSFSIIVLDIDNFKNYNDHNGHTAGDTLLTVIANIFIITCRKSDIIFRYGGEEFVILLPDTNENGAYLLAEKIRKKVHENVFPYEEFQPNKSLTVSLGLASFPENISDAQDLFDAADQALYHSKNTGRNKVSLYSNIEKKDKSI